jgi:HEAT repeat protein
MSDALTMLRDEAQDGSIRAIREIGQSGDTSFIPQLTQILSQVREKDPQELGYRHIDETRLALARLGHAGTRREIIKDLGNNRHVRQRAFALAEAIGDQEFITAIAERLYDDRLGEREHDVGYAAPRHQAVVALSRLIDDPNAPTIDLK